MVPNNYNAKNLVVTVVFCLLDAEACNFRNQYNEDDHDDFLTKVMDETSEAVWRAPHRGPLKV